ncbi:MAG TPA: Hsp70 family protein [Streptomyces sp.]
MARLGIDIGTWSVAVILEDAGGRRLVPDPETGQLWARSSIARGPQGGWLLGTGAEQVRGAHPELYRDDIKRLLDSDRPAYLGGAPYQTAELLAQILNRCLANARELSDEPIEELILGVPVSFEGARAEVLRAAAGQVGFHTSRVTLVPEPVAAARATLGDSQEPGTWLVFDLGGGTLDLALVRTGAEGELTVLDTAGDAAIGGYLIDDAITEHLRTSHGLPEPDENDAWELSELAEAARSLKHQLTGSTVAYARNPYRTGPTQLTLSRTDLAELTKPVTDTALACGETLLTANGFTWSGLTATIATGGATRSPAISDALSLRTSVRRGPHPAELATAHGLFPVGSGVPLQRPPAPPRSRNRGRKLPAAFPSGASSVRKKIIQKKNLSSLRCLRTITGHNGGVWDVVFSPDGAFLATASYDKTSRIWDVATGATRATFIGHTGGLSGVAFSPDGTLLATTSDIDRTARVWDVATATTQATLTGHTEGVSGVAFSPDGTLLATASNDKTVRIWGIA